MLAVGLELFLVPVFVLMCSGVDVFLNHSALCEGRLSDLVRLASQLVSGIRLHTLVQKHS